MPQLVLAHRSRRVDLVAEDKEGDLRELLDGEEGVELRLGLGEALEVGAVDEEDDPVDLGEVVPPEAARCSRQVSYRAGKRRSARRTLLVTAQVVRRELHVANGKLLRR